MQRNATTRFPILLVHGLFGFDRIGTSELFHDIRQALLTAGARVFIPYLSATHSTRHAAHSCSHRLNGSWSEPVRPGST